MRFIKPRKYRNACLSILVLFLFFYLIPFFVLITGSLSRNYIFREISYRTLYNKITLNDLTDSAKAISIFNFAINTISNQPDNFFPKDLNQLDIIFEAVGSCDQQSNVIITISGIGGIKGNLQFLYCNDSISHHSVCELFINGKYILFDPYYKVYFINKFNNLASFKDIQNNVTQQIICKNKLPKDYFKFYSKKIPSKLFITNEIPWTKKISREFIAVWEYVGGNYLCPLFNKLYFKLDKTSKLRIVKINKLLLSNTNE